MRVSFENGVSTYSGKYKEVVYQSWFHNQLCFLRRYTYPEMTVQNDLIKAISLNLSSLYRQASTGYTDDLKAYARKFSKEHQSSIKAKMRKMPYSKSFFVQCMWAWAKTDPEHIDLKSVTMEDITSAESPVVQVKKCVDSGYLLPVKGYEEFTHDIVSS